MTTSSLVAVPSSGILLAPKRGVEGTPSTQSQQWGNRGVAHWAVQRDVPALPVIASPLCTLDSPLLCPLLSALNLLPVPLPLRPVSPHPDASIMENAKTAERGVRYGRNQISAVPWRIQDPGVLSCGVGTPMPTTGLWLGPEHRLCEAPPLASCPRSSPLWQPLGPGQPDPPDILISLLHSLSI